MMLITLLLTDLDCLENSKDSSFKFNATKFSLLEFEEDAWNYKIVFISICHTSFYRKSNDLLLEIYYKLYLIVLENWLS